VISREWFVVRVRKLLNACHGEHDNDFCHWPE
jgi:hypothetical protein